MANKLLVTDWSDPTAMRVVSEKEAARYDASFVYPESARAEILEVIEKRAALRKQHTDSFSLVLQLNNKLVREGRRR